MKKSNIVPLNASAGAQAMSVDHHFQTGSSAPDSRNAPSATRRMTAPLRQLQDKAHRELNKSLQAMFDKADDALFDLAEKAASNSEQNHFFESMRELRLKRRDIESGFAENLRAAFTALFVENTADAEQDAELSVMEDDVVEEMVAVETMIAKAEKRHSSELETLSIRIEHLAGISVSLNNNPLAPKSICQGFSDACMLLSIDIKARLVLFKLFDMHVVDKLDNVYSLSQQTLVANNVLPELRAGGRARRERKVVGASRQKVRDLGSQDSDRLSDVDIFQLLHEAQASPQLPAMLGPLSNTLHRLPVSNTPTIGHDVVFQLLNTLQQQHALQSSEFVRGGAMVHSEVLSPESVAISLLESLRSFSKQGDHSIGQAESDAIGLVAMLFQFVLDAGNLAEPMKVLISQLQVPVIKVVLNDPEFFNKRNHPARCLLNELTSAAIGWAVEKDYHKDALYQKMSESVSKVIDEYDEDIAIFHDVLADFISFSSNEKRRASLLEKRIVDAEAGRDESESARSFVSELVAARHIDKSLPAFIANLVQSTWSNVLFLLYVKEGVESQRWIEAVEAMDNLLWTVDPERCAKDRAEIMKMLPGILKAFRKGLAEINFDGFAAGEFFAHLEHLHMEVMQRPEGVASSENQLETVDAEQRESKISLPGGEGNSVDSESAELDADAESQSTEADASPNRSITDQTPGQTEPEATNSAPETSKDTSAGASLEASPAIEPGLLNDAEKLTVGQWVELYDEQGKSRCRLVAVLRNSGKRIFANRTGAKVGEFTVEDIAIRLGDERMVLLDDARLFDKALASVIDTMRQSSASSNNETGV